MTRNKGRMAGLAVALVSTILSSAEVIATPQVFVDSSFGNGGVATIAYATTTALTPEGKILALGQDSGTQVLYRYKRDGSPDIAFGNMGAIRLYANGSAFQQSAYSSLLVAADGSFYLAGYAVDGCKVNILCNSSVLARFFADGELDTSFGINGFAPLSIGQYNPTGQDIRLAFGPDGSIVAAENSYSSSGNHLVPVSVRTRIERFNVNGGSVASWPLVSSCQPGVYELGVQADGSILVAVSPTLSSSAEQRCLSRYTYDGELDYSFGTNGVVDWAAALGDWSNTSGMIGSSKGTVTLGAFTTSTSAGTGTTGSLGRFLPTGGLDTAFGVPNGAGTAPANVSTLAASCGGKIVGAALGYDSSYSYIGLVRYNSNGSLDLTASGTADGIVSKFISFVGEATDVLVRDDGVIIVHTFGRTGGSVDAPPVGFLVA